MLAPDGKRYAYDGPDGVHDVDLLSGSDRTVLTDPPGQVYQYGTDGIYLSKYGAYAGHLGLWRLNPQTGSVTQVLPVSVAFDQLGSGAAWYVEPRSEGPAPTTLYRIDLVTSARQVWSIHPNTFVVHLGTDPVGRPLVGWVDFTNNLSKTELLVMPIAGQGTLIQEGTQESTPWDVALNDTYGVWFQSGSLTAPLWLLQSDDHVITVAQAAVQPLGACN